MKARLSIGACQSSVFLRFYEKPRLCRQRWPADLDRIETKREEGPKRYNSMFWAKGDNDLRTWLSRLYDCCTQSAFLENDGLCVQRSWPARSSWVTSFIGTTTHRTSPSPHLGEVALEVAGMQRGSLTFV